MSKICAFTVYGDAKPQGSTTTFTRRLANGELRPAITHSNRESLMQWRADIRAAVQQQVAAMPGGLVTGPVGVRVWFWLAKPPSVPKRRLFPTVAPDLDKLQRALGDALEHVLLRSDAQIVHWEAWKVYTDSGPAYAQVELWQPDQVLVPAADNPFHQRGLF